MKAFVGLVVGVILVGLLLVGLVGAFGFGLSEDVVTVESGPIGVRTWNAFPHLDAVAIEVQWTVEDPEATYILQRTTDPDSGEWDEVFALAPGSNAYVDDVSAVYVDTNVERLQQYFYRFYFVNPAGGEGYTSHMAVTPV